jgi:hypothetical protein
MTGLTPWCLCFPYFRTYLLVPTLFALERCGWTQARRRSMTLIAQNAGSVGGVVTAAVGLALLLASLSLFLLETCLPWVMAVFDVSVSSGGWLSMLENLLLFGTGATVLPLLEISLVLLYDQVLTVREGRDLEEAMERLL